MAAPHAAGLAALLLSALRQERRPVDARTLRQALMVTARPAAYAGYLDQGRGLADVDAAYRWLAQGGKAPAVEVKAQQGTTAALVLDGQGERRGPAIRGAPSRRCGAGEVRTSERRRLAHRPRHGHARRRKHDHRAALLRQRALRAGRVHRRRVGLVRGQLRRSRLPAGDHGRHPARRHGQRPGAPPGRDRCAAAKWSAPSSTPIPLGRSRCGCPRGRVWRERPISTSRTARPTGKAAAGRWGSAEGTVYRVDARDVQEGDYQVAASPAPGGRLALSATVRQAPFTMRASRAGDAVESDCGTVTGTPVRAALEFRLRGGERQRHGARLGLRRAAGPVRSAGVGDRPGGGCGDESGPVGPVHRLRRDGARFRRPPTGPGSDGVRLRPAQHDRRRRPVGNPRRAGAGSRIRRPGGRRPWSVGHYYPAVRRLGGGCGAGGGGRRGDARRRERRARCDFELPSMPWALPSGLRPDGRGPRASGRAGVDPGGRLPERSAAR